MTTDMITVKLEDTFLKNIDETVKKEGYQNRTEFIRAALREKIEEAKLKEAMINLNFHSKLKPHRNMQKTIIWSLLCFHTIK